MFRSGEVAQESSLRKGRSGKFSEDLLEGGFVLFRLPSLFLNDLTGLGGADAFSCQGLDSGDGSEGLGFFLLGHGWWCADSRV